PLLRELRMRKIRRDAAPDPRKREREVVQRVELVRIALGDPHRVIAVLLTAARILSRCLQVAVRIRAYPDALPGGRYREAPDPLERLAAANQTSARTAIGESLIRRLARDSGLGIDRGVEHVHASRLRFASGARSWRGWTRACLAGGTRRRKYGISARA